MAQVMFSEEIRVTGWVQGVGFRAHVERCADATGVKGRVWNLPVAGVCIIAQHEDAEVLYNDFLRRVAAGPGKVGLLLLKHYEGEPFPDFAIRKP